jgi:hypothetical protein
MRNIFLNMADFAEFSFSFVYFDYFIISVNIYEV